MKRLLIVLFCPFIFLNVFSQEKSNSIEELIRHNYNAKDYEFTRSKENPNIELLSHRDADKVTGLVAFNYSDFSADKADSMEVIYENGIPNGIINCFDSKNSFGPHITGNYLNGVVDGSWKWYNINGKVIREINYKSGELDGLFKEWYGNGQLKEVNNYSLGLSFSNVIYQKWYSNGQLCEEGHFNERVPPEFSKDRQGDFKSWYPNGNIRSKCFYENDTLNGKYSQWFENGMLMSERRINNGKIYNHLRWDEQGKLMYEIDFNKVYDTSEVNFFNDKIKYHKSSRDIGVYDRLFFKDTSLVYFKNDSSLFTGVLHVDFSDLYWNSAEGDQNVIFNYINGKQEGWRITYLRSCIEVQSESYIKDAEITGLSYLYGRSFQNSYGGSLYYKVSPNKEGEIHGTVKLWYKNGEKEEQGYKQGYPDGDSKKWYSNGQQKFILKLDENRHLIIGKCWNEKGAEIECEHFNSYGTYH